MTPGALVSRRELLTLVLDTLVPASGDFPGAGTVALDHVLAIATASADLESRLSRALQAVEESARTNGSADFSSLSVDDRESVLARVERSHPELFEPLLRHTYDGYYSHPSVITRLGLAPGPLHPHGHRVETVALPDLTRVSARGSIYRQG